jgi:hypothetical protein
VSDYSPGELKVLKRDFARSPLAGLLVKELDDMFPEVHLLEKEGTELYRTQGYRRVVRALRYLLGAWAE